MSEYNLLKEISNLKKINNDSDARNVLAINNNVNSLVLDLMYDSCIIDFTKSTNIEVDDYKNITIAKENNECVIVTNEISSNSDNETVTNIISKIYCEPMDEKSFETFIITNDVQYPISTINFNNEKYFKENINSFRLKIKITKSDKVISPVITGYAVFFKDNGVL